jgi:hypothetical protein
VGVGDFIGIVSVLLGLLMVLVLWIAPFVGLGLAAYYVFRGRVSLDAQGAGRRDTARCRAWTRPDLGRNSPLLERHQRVIQVLKPRSGSPGPQEGARRPWWRRMFGS